jgi:Raf kinase inhibitor-like YbhB/YbcL family protein
MSRLPLLLCFVSITAVAAASCSSGGDDGNPGTAGAAIGGRGGGAAGSSAGAPGSGGAGGAPSGAAGSGPAGAPGNGGTTGAAGSAAGAGGSSGSSGSTGAAGASAGRGGTPGAGGATGSAGTGANGGRGGGSAGTAGGGGSTGAMTLTSTAFIMDGTIPTASTCASGGNGASPDLTWTMGPMPATRSYAVVLTDLTNGYVHWVIWDIPAATTTLPAMLGSGATLNTPPEVNGAKQKNAFSGNGYYGPCPGAAPPAHRYQFVVHAIDAMTLPSATTSMSTTNLKTLVLAHSIGTGELIGMSNAARP